MTSSSARATTATSASSRTSSSESTTTAATTSTRTSTQACTASAARRSRPRPSSSTASAPIHGTVPEWIEEQNWFFRLSAYQDAAARALRRAARLRPAVVPLQRGPQLHRGRSPATSRSAARRRRGAFRSPGIRTRSPTSGPTRSSTTCSALTLRAPGREPRAVLARRAPPARQGHPSLPLRLLAGAAARGRLRAAEAAVRPRLPATRRPQDLEVARQRDRPARPDRRLRRRRGPLLVRPRHVSFGQDGNVSIDDVSTSATSASSPTTSATSSRGRRR